MTYGLTVYGPLDTDHMARQRLSTLMATAFPVDYTQIQTVWETMCNFPGFNHVDIDRCNSGDLVIHVYGVSGESTNSVFHTKILPSGAYA